MLRDELTPAQCQWPACNCYHPQGPHRCKFEPDVLGHLKPRDDAPIITYTTPSGRDDRVRARLGLSDTD